MPTKSLKATKPSSLLTHLATTELKQRILNSLSKLSDRDTHQIAVDDLETVIKTVAPDGIKMVLNTLYDATTTTTNKPATKKEAIRLLSFMCATHTDLTATHLIKIITNILKCLKDSDSGVRDSCCESIGHLSFLYVKGGDCNVGYVVSLFVKPLFDAMNEQNKWVQAGAAMCLGKMVELAADPPILTFQKLCVRICKFLNSPNFLANAALLPVISSLSQIGAISPQALDPLLQSIHNCIGNADWTIRKAAADTLNALALHSSNLIIEKPTSTITLLEACRFDKIKPVRDSVTEALILWKFIADGSEDKRTPGNDQHSEPPKMSKKYLQKLDDKQIETPVQNGQTNGQDTSETTTGTKKKAPPLSDKPLNPEFFQRLERRISGEVEVVVNRRFSILQNEENTKVNDDEVEKSKSKENLQPDGVVNVQDSSLESGHGGPVSRRREFDNNGNLLGIQRQLMQLEKQQAHLMNMLQDFKGGSRNGMVTLEKRVWGLERVVEDMAHNLSLSMNNLRTSCSTNGFSDYPNTKFWRNDDVMSYKGRTFHARGQNTQFGSWKRVGPVRFGEGPSARSVWKSSNDEATLEAIRGAAPETMTVEKVSNVNLKRDPWKIAMDEVHKGDMDGAFREVLSTGDDFLLVKLMDKTGPLIDRISSDVACDVLHAVAQFLLVPSLFHLCLSWIQQLLDFMVENGTDSVKIPEEVRKAILVNLNEALTSNDPPENWEGLTPDNLFLQLASVWDNDMH
ncbi:microtubule-associated protein TORTIFOLIA1-like [Rutidosis leptorrhynchoides]|uniref:microtubule-associated protein TORTIFOLIA1-like n=1 Tax=Rutidosis leptorrhynchoides TaxID=125765 RepID=UPI003A99A354